MIRLTFVLVIAAACKNSAGESCSLNADCKSGRCDHHVCQSGERGASCYLDDHCKSPLKCGGFVCLPPEEVPAADAKWALDKKNAEAAAEGAKEQKLMAQSGVTASPAQAERASGAGAHVRVVKTSADGTAFAACRTDERLIGGSCSGPTNVDSAPAQYGEDDTVGARWTCRASNLASLITAYALCAKLP